MKKIDKSKYLLGGSKDDRDIPGKICEIKEKR